MKIKSYFPYKNYFKGLRDMSAEDLLESIGLQTKRSTFRNVASSVGILSAGILLGVGIGFAFAPRRGEQIRREIRERAETMKSKMGHYGEKAAELAEEVRQPSFDA